MEGIDLGQPMQLEKGERLIPRPLDGGKPQIHTVRVPSFVQTRQAQPLPVGTQLAGDGKFSFRDMVQGAAAPLSKLGGLSLKDMKLDDLLLIGLALILLHEKSDYDILLVLAYLFIIGL